MKICIVIQSDAFRSSAGMRIRYDRFADQLRGSDATIEARTVPELAAGKSFEHDVYIFCKTFETAALLLARQMRAAGKAVGQDVFDDYFSQKQDPRLERFRQWMRDMAPVTDFAVCSTVRLAEVLKGYLPGVRITPIEDPLGDFYPDRVAELADRKVAEALRSRQIEAVWFGIGDNPYFPVGLQDLVNWEREIARLEDRGWDVRLQLVTNRRPFEGAGAEILDRLSLRYELVEWTEEVERSSLEAATLAILPVNGQAFSRAKSMNRAVTALNAGCQVLSLGYPLYRELDAYIYRSADELADDLEVGTSRVGSKSIQELASHLGRLADPKRAAETFVAEAATALASVRARGPERRLVCLLHGRNSNIDLHKAVGAQGGLSVGTPFNRSEWNFPVRFDRVGQVVVMRVTPQLAGTYALPISNPEQLTRIGAFDFVRVDCGALGVPELRIDLPAKPDPIVDLPAYADVMRFAAECCLAAFSDAEILISDTSPFARRPSIPAVRSKAPWQRPRAARQSRSTQPGPQVLDKVRSAFRSRARKKVSDREMSLIGDTPLFDGAWYLRRYPDVAATAMDPAHHYLEFGWREGRDPGPNFSTRGYLQLYADVAATGVNPLIHYLEHGAAEGRVAPVSTAPPRRT